MRTGTVLVVIGVLLLLIGGSITTINMIYDDDLTYFKIDIPGKVVVNFLGIGTPNVVYYEGSWRRCTLFERIQADSLNILDWPIIDWLVPDAEVGSVRMIADGVVRDEQKYASKAGEDKRFTLSACIDRESQPRIELLDSDGNIIQSDEVVLG